MTPLSTERWLQFDATAPAPTFFARPAWALALCDADPHLSPFAATVHLDGRRYIIPGVRGASRAGFSHVDAFPLGGYTCVLDEGGRLADALTSSRALAEAAAKIDYLHAVPWPLGPAPVARHAQRRELETAVIDCSNGYEAAIANVRGVTRRMAGQALRRGVECAPSQKTQRDIDAYYDILIEASAGWGLSAPPYSRALIDAVIQRGGDDVELWFAQAEGQRVAGGIIFFGKDELFFWSAAMRRAHAQLRPSNALNFALIARACERGVRWYNLGGSAGLAGVERFKTDLGAQTVPYYDLTFKRVHYAMYERLRTALRPRMEAS